MTPGSITLVSQEVWVWDGAAEAGGVPPSP